MAKSLEELQDIAKRIRREIIVMIGAAKSGRRPMEFVGIHDTYAESGQPDELLDKYGLIARDVVAAVRKVLARKR